jgi:allantoin racemase
MRENIRSYGKEHALASIRPLDLGVHDFQRAGDVRERLMREGRKAVEEDGAEALILGCTAEFGFNDVLQEQLGVPVIDALQASLVHAECLADAALRLGWRPSRKWGSEAPPESEIAAWGLFDQAPPIGALLAAPLARAAE